MVTTPTRSEPVSSRPPAVARTKGATAAGQQGFFAKLWYRLEGHGSDGKSSYYLILGCTLALVAIGLIMVFSASSVELTSKNNNPLSLGIKESIFAAIGIVAMLVLSRMPRRLLQVMAWPLMIISLFLLVIVLFIGTARGGNLNWIEIGDFTFQPSELSKMALILWMATIFSAKEKLLSRWQHMFLPVVPVTALVVGLIVLEHDLGTSMILMLIAAFGLYFAGASAFIFLGAGILSVIASLMLALGNSNRTGRIGAWLGQCDAGNDPQGLCDQAQSSMFALASGGWFGVGLGQGRQKWNWLPEAHNDFIFAIVGEELGLLGTLLVVGLYTVLAIAMFRVTVRAGDMFSRVLCGCVMVWVIGQAFVNIAMVIGLLPVIGVPLPLISYGGSALTVGLAGMGLVLGVARKNAGQGKAAPPNPAGFSTQPAKNIAPKSVGGR